MTKKLRVAIAGSGYFSRFHIDAWTRCPEVQIVAIASIDDASGRRLAQSTRARFFHDCASMLDGVDADILDIVTPPDTHLALIETAVSRRVTVVCQKPFCGDLRTASRATDIAAHCETTLIVHENFRFQPWYEAIRRELADGRLGRVYQATFRLRPGDGQGAEAYLDRQPYFRSMPHFLVHETAVHHIDVMRFLFGEPVAVWADLRRLNPTIAGEDAGMIVLDHGDGLRAVIDGNRLADHPAKNRRLTMGEMVVEGERGCLTLDGNGQLLFRPHGDNGAVAIDYAWDDRGFGGDCVYRFTRHVVDHFTSRTPLQTLARDYLANLVLEEAVYRSHEQGTRVWMEHG